MQSLRQSHPRQASLMQSFRWSRTQQSQPATTSFIVRMRPHPRPFGAPSQSNAHILLPLERRLHPAGPHIACILPLRSESIARHFELVSPLPLP